MYLCRSCSGPPDRAGLALLVYTRGAQKRIFIVQEVLIGSLFYRNHREYTLRHVVFVGVGDAQIRKRHIYVDICQIWHRLFLLIYAAKIINGPRRTETGTPAVA